MADNKIFFSYSRDNSEFVIELAKELREAGATIWLDQLDIKPGTRWDRSIEEALKSSNTLLVILSKSSVASHNVMDEVSYALEESRTVVPVLLEDCDIPFRLRRLQYADFSQSHEKGIKTLIKALHLERDVANKLVDIAAEVESAKKVVKPTPAPEKPKAKADPIAAPLEEPKVVEQEPEPPRKQPTPAPPANKSTSKLPMLLGLAALIIAGIFLVPKFLGNNEAATTEDTSATENTEVPTINPSGTVATNTNSTGEEALETEVSEMDNAWETAKINNHLDGYLKFMEDYPDWEDDYDMYEFLEARFLSFFPREGYIQYSTSGGLSYFKQLRSYEVFTPSEGDILEITNDRNVKAGVYGTSGFSRTLNVMHKGDRCIVLEVIPSGSAYWINVAY